MANRTILGRDIPLRCPIAQRAHPTITLPRDAVRAFSVGPVFRLVFAPTRSNQCETRRAYRCARKCARQRNRAALAGGLPEAERSDNCRSTPATQKTQAQLRHV